MTNILWNPQCGKIHWNSLYLVYCAPCHLLQLFLVISSGRNGNRFHSALCFQKFPSQQTVTCAAQNKVVCVELSLTLSGFPPVDLISTGWYWGRNNFIEPDITYTLRSIHILSILLTPRAPHSFAKKNLPNYAKCAFWWIQGLLYQLQIADRSVNHL